MRGKVPLVEYCILPPEWDSGYHLFELLRQWAGTDLVIDKRCARFITSEGHNSGTFGNPPWVEEFSAGLARRVARFAAKREMGGYYSGGVFHEFDGYAFDLKLWNRGDRLHQ